MADKSVESCDDHELSTLGYVDFHVDAEIRSKRGERQVRCRECNKWQWPRTPAQEQTGENE